MKDHNEFRKTVFEKAKAYEAARRARRKKLIEAASLCSVAIALSVIFYLGLIPTVKNHEETPTTDTAGSASFTTSSTAYSTSTAESVSATSTTATAESTHTTEDRTTEISTIPTDTTIEWSQTTVYATSESRTETTCESTRDIPPEEIVLVNYISTAATNPTLYQMSYSWKKIETLEQWQDFLRVHGANYAIFERAPFYFDFANEEYFKERGIVVLQYRGYDAPDAVAFSNENEENICRLTLTAVTDDTQMLNIYQFIKNDVNEIIVTTE